MNKEQDDLENRTIKEFLKGKVSLERALLVASGLDEEGVETYVGKIDKIQENFTEWLKEKKNVQQPQELSVYDRAEALFNYLWETKPDRYNSNFLLADVIDAQLSENVNEKVGNCIGLTSLYTVLGIRNGLELSVLYTNTQMFDESHTLNLLHDGDQEVVIENIHPSGFNFKKESDSENIILEYNAEESKTLRIKFKKGTLKTLLASEYNNKGIEKNDLGDVEESITDFDKAIELDPNFAIAYCNRGTIKSSLNDLEGAIDDYNKAIELDPNFADAYCNRGNAQQKLKKYKKAIKDYNKAIELQPNYAKAFNNKAGAKIKLRKFKKAIKDFNRAIELDPNFAIAYCNRGNAQQKLKRFEEAIDDYTKAIKLDPDYASAYFNRGYAKQKLKRFEEAIEDYNKALKLKPDYKKAYRNKKLCERKLKGPLLTRFLELFKLKPYKSS